VTESLRSFLALALALTLCACKVDPVQEPGSSPEFPRANVDYRGDLVNFESSSRIFRQLSPEGQLALLALANAEVFTAAQIGFSGNLSPHATAFRALLREPEGLKCYPSSRPIRPVS
jgi:hypothetical protein